MPPKKAASKENGKELVKDYLLKQNRPYNAITIGQNLHNEVGKTDLAKFLDALVSEGVLMSKDYKKLRYYWPNQGIVEKRVFIEFCLTSICR